MEIQQAVIAAGGFGTRLRPTTDTMPKPMIPILGKPMLEWHVMQFKKFGVKEVLFTLHYLPAVVMNYFGDGEKFGIRTHYYIEKTPLGTAGGLKALEPRLDERFYYIYGDTFSLLDYGQMKDDYVTTSNPIGMQRMERTDNYADADVAEIDAEGRFKAIHPKPHTATYPNAYRMRGVFILEKKILAYMPSDAASDLAKDVLPQTLAAGENFYSYECDDYSKGIDTREKWREVEDYLRVTGVSRPR